MRLKVFWHEKQQNIDSETPAPDSITADQLNYSNNKSIFPSKRSALISSEIIGFKSDLFNLCENLKIKKSKCKNQSDLNKSINEMKEK